MIPFTHPADKIYQVHSKIKDMGDQEKGYQQPITLGSGRQVSLSVGEVSCKS